MGRLIASVYVSADGIYVAPGEDLSWVINAFNHEMAAYAEQLQQAMGAVLLGRVTYDGMTIFWPTAADDVPGAIHMNRAPKYVATKSLQQVHWGDYDNAQRLGNDLFTEIADLKATIANDIVLFGSGQLLRVLATMGLVDEFHLLVHPILLGHGKRLFDGLAATVPLQLLRVEVFANGVTLMCYAPAGPPDPHEDDA